MVRKKSKSQIANLLGERLDYLRIKRGFYTIDEFARKFNNGKKHNDFSPYIKGKNIRFDSLVKFAMTANVDVPTLLDFKNEHPFQELNNDISFQEMVQCSLNVFCENIVAYRKEKFKTQLDFEQKIGINRENLTNYETGKIKPTLVRIEDFANAFEIEPRYLFVRRS